MEEVDELAELGIAVLPQEAEGVVQTPTEEETSAVSAFNALKSTDTAEVVQALQNKEVVSMANTDEQVREKIKENAKEIISTHTDTIAKDTKRVNQEANFKVNQFACEIYGVDESCPIWQQKLMKMGSSFWFLIYWIIASVTIVPIHIFIKMLGKIVKKNFVSWLLAVLFYMIVVGLIVGTPLLLSFR